MGRDPSTQPLPEDRRSEGLPPLRRYPRDVTLFDQEETVADPLLIEVGIVKLSHLSPTGAEGIVDFRFAGALLGLASAIGGQPSPVSATTVTPCHIRRIPQLIINQCLARLPAFSATLVTTLTSEVMKLTENLINLQSLSAVERLKKLFKAMLFDGHLTNSHQGARLPPFLTRREMAQFIGITPEYLSHLLAELETTGIIRRSKGWITVDEQNLLESLDA